MKKNQVEKTGQKLQFRFALIGQYVRLSAVKKLTDFGTADTIPYLIDALGSFDLKVADAALKSLHSLKKLIPLSRSQNEVILALCSWLTEGRAQLASFNEKQQAQDQFVLIEISKN